MKDIQCTIPSSDQTVSLSLIINMPKTPTEIVLFAHGMAEHKERYLPFMHYLNAHGYGCVIYDHRGHGNSVASEEDLGYLNDHNGIALVEDLHSVCNYIKRTYPHIPVYLFAHSMGSLIVKNYLKKYDQDVEKVVLCGSPFHNKQASFGLFVTKLETLLFGKKHRSNWIHNLAIKHYDRKFRGFKQNRWLSVDEENVDAYNTHEKCGFIFTLNGFQNLFSLILASFQKESYEVHNKELSIFFIAGEDDPIIGNKKQFNEQQSFMKSLGYKRVIAKTYPHMRHEILHEKDKMKVYQDVLTYFYY